MDDIETRYGTLTGVSAASLRPDGTPRSVCLTRPAAFATSVGELTAQYRGDDERRSLVQTLEFHPNGALRSLPLQERTDVSTPLGSLPAELVTFHDDGTLRGVYPLSGKLSGYWNEQDEYTLAPRLELDTPVGGLAAKWISVQFFPSGRLRSLTLWPAERLRVETPTGPVPARIGLAFHETGALRSVEPATHHPVRTPIGTVTAFDPLPLGVSGDVNSLAFTPEGELLSLRTVTTLIHADCGGRTRTFAPASAFNPCDEAGGEIAPLTLRFEKERVFFTTRDGEDTVLPLKDCTFRTENLPTPLAPMPGTSCG